jgi:L-ascorbate metabolism protein UlaG (beta-lactamase superfamily)
LVFGVEVCLKLKICSPVLILMRSTFIRNLIKLCALLVVLTNTVCSQTKQAGIPKTKSKAEIQITYIANEGVLIKTKNRQILIDGLHRKYKDAYAFPPDDLREKLEGALSPYNAIDLVLVSHLHGDHFHPLSVGEYLKNNPKSILASSAQVIGEIKKDFSEYKKIKPQIREISHEWKKSSAEIFDGIRVKFLGLRHANENYKWIQNFGHLIEADGKKFLHLGDADMTDENFSEFKLNKEKIDVAFIPYWFLLSQNGRDLVEKQFAPKHIIAIHVSPNEGAEVSENLKKHYSEITVFTKILETKDF